MFITVMMFNTIPSPTDSRLSRHNRKELDMSKCSLYRLASKICFAAVSVLIIGGLLFLFRVIENLTPWNVIGYVILGLGLLVGVLAAIRKE